MKIEWTQDKLRVGTETLQYITNLSEMFELDSANGYVFSKNKQMIEQYHSYLKGAHIDNIFELGIYRGGSTVFFNEYCQPKKFVAIDYNNQCTDLENYIQKKSLSSIIKPYYRTDQSDIDTIKKIYKKEFGDELLDLVTDDASHFLEETRTSFNILFPKLKPGGLYIIEDWRWAHTNLSGPKGIFIKKKPLTNLLFEAIIACAHENDLIEEVIINKNMCVIRKGSEMCNNEEFNINNYVKYRGKETKAVDYFSIHDKFPLRLFKR